MNAKFQFVTLSNGTVRCTVQSQGRETSCVGKNKAEAQRNAIQKFNLGVRIEKAWNAR